MFADKNIQVDTLDDIMEFYEHSIDESEDFEEPPEEYQEQLFDYEEQHYPANPTGCEPSFIDIIWQPIFKIAVICVIFYAVLVLKEHLSALDELTSVNRRICDLEFDLTNQLDAEAEARKSLGRKEQEDVKKIHVKIEALENNVRNLTSALVIYSDGLKSEVAHNMSVYHADRVGKPDFALQSAGGRIASTRETVTYSLRSQTYFLGFIPLYQEHNSPSLIINPSMFPGHCWAFRGSQGKVVIQLFSKALITGVTMEHVSRRLAPTGNTSSAPKDFSIWGLTDIEEEGFFFGKFHFDNTAEPYQYFNVTNESAKAFKYVELKVHSNHGNPEYTCLYRVRIHGKMETM